MDEERLAEGLLEHTDAVAAAVAGADPAARVPTCPDWPLSVLIGHLGQAHRWSAANIRSGPSPVPDPFDADPGEPGDWADWLRAGAADLVAAVRAAKSPVWTFFGTGPASFWLRRMAHDTTVHHADVALTTGADFTVADDLATDAITEWLEILADPATPTLKPELAHLRGTGQTLQVSPENGEGWLITRTPDGVRWTRGTATADTTLAGRVGDLLLVLTRRRSPDEVTTTGNRTLLDHWLTHTAA